MASTFEMLKAIVSLVSTLLWLSLLGLPHVLAELFYLVFPRSQKDIKNDIVLVTGSGQGLGRELALLFAQQGCEVVCVDVMPEENLTTVELIHSQGGKARAYVCNVADREAVMKLGKAVGRVDILVNNAGIYPIKSLWNASEEEMRTIIDINLFSQFWTIQAFLPSMKERNHGHVVCISSLCALIGLGYMIPYVVSKCGVAGIMSSLSQELHSEKKNIKLTTVYPYIINTRPEIKESVKGGFPSVKVKTAAAVILKGVLEDLDSFTVPQYFYQVMNVNRFTSAACQLLMSEYIFPFQISAPKHDTFAEVMENGLFRKTGNIKTQ